jgi:ketosteroid isomerase-like protein
MQAESVFELIPQLEKERGRALVARDWPRLSELIAPDLVHIHANGSIENRQAYLDSVRSKLEFIRVERESLEVRSYGDTAIATGILKQTIRLKDSGAMIDMRLATTQVWGRTNNQWLQRSFHATHVQ